MITVRYYHNGTYGFSIKTDITDRRGVKIGYNGEGYTAPEQASEAAEDILKSYRKKHKIVEI